MKPQHALPLLSAAASFMVLGLVLGGADAQPPETPTVQVRPGAARPRLGNAARANVSPDDASESPSERGAGGTGLPEFETGVDYEPVSPATRVTFNLEDADLPDLVRLISNLTGKRFILSSKVRSLKATVFAPTKVTVAEAYNAFLSILEVNGMTVVPSGRYLKISETANIENQPIPLYTGGSPTPNADRFITRLHRVENVSAEDAAQLLSRFKSQAGAVTAYAPTNTLILTDTGTQIRRMLRLVEAIDVSRTGEQIWIEPIHYANATEIASKLQEIFPSSQGASSGGAAATPATPRAAPRRARATANAATTGGNAQTGAATIGSRAGESRITSIISDERTNSLIILATERAYLRILEMIRHLDVPMEGEGRIHVHYVQNGDAEEVASTLQSLIGGGGAPRAGGGAAGAAGAAGRRPAAAAAAPAAAAGGELGGMFEGEIRVTTHTPTNALVITSSLHDYAALRRVIERLDRPRRQVFIEAVVMDLSVNRSSQLGFAFHGGVPDPAGDGSLSIFGFDPGRSLFFPADQSVLTGMAVGVRGPEIETNVTIPGSTTGLSIPGFGVVLQAVANSGDANILSTPHIIAMDNVQAEINIGQNVPLQTSGLAPGALGGLGGLGALAGLAGGAQGGAAGALGGLGGLGGGFGVPRQDVGTIIRVTPHINQHDEIRMEIEEEISDVGSPQGDLGVVPINRRTAKTEVMVRDQQTVVIGGLMRETVTTSESKIPVLGDIPLLGALFRRTERQRQKSNLLLFLTPYIIRDMADLRAIYERKMRERQEFLDRYFVFGDHDYEPPVDYSRTRGLVAEIIGELRELDEELAIEAALEAEPPPEHVARSPIGIYDGPAEGEEGDVIITPDGEGGTLDAPPEPAQSVEVTGGDADEE